MNTIDLSFVIPMYNSAKYIRACLDSIINQGIPSSRYEIIVIDDGSLDDGKSVIDGEGYSNVTYIYQKNQGQASARNKGIELAKGKYVCFVDSDDLLVPNSLLSILDIAVNHQLDLITYDMIGCTEKEILNVIPRRSNELGIIYSGFDYIEKYNFNNGPCWYLVRRDLLANLRFIEGRYAEDGMFTMTLLMHVKTVMHIKADCYYYVVRPNSTTTSRNVSHVYKTVDDYYYAYQYMSSLISENKLNLSERGYARCAERSESYIFFLLVRLLYCPYEFSKKWYNKIKAEKLLPIKPPYPGLKLKATSIVLNNSVLFFTIRFVYNIYLNLQRK